MSLISNISIFGFGNISIYETEDEAVALFNKLVVDLNISHPRIFKLTDLQPYIYSRIFESVFRFPAPDIIQDPTTFEHNIQNVQAIIDTLSLDILNISLAEITGEDVVSLKPESVCRLLKLFSGCFQVLRSNDSDVEEKGASIMTSESSMDHSESRDSSDEFRTSKSCHKTSSVLFSIKESQSCSSSNQRSEDQKLSFVTPIIGHLKRSESKLRFDASTSSFKSGVKKLAKKQLRVLSTPVRRRSVLMARYTKKRIQQRCKRIIESSHQISKDSQEGGILSEINANLPGLYAGPQTKRVMGKNLADHIKMCTNRIFEMQHRKSKSQKLVEAANLKQKKLKDIAVKDMKESETLNKCKDVQQTRTQIRAALREQGQSRVKTRQYYKELHLKHRQIMSQKSTKEEVLLHGLFKDRLRLQKEQLIDVKKEFKLLEDSQAAQQSQKISSLECLYDNQIEELKEETKNLRSVAQQRRREKIQEIDKKKRDVRERRLKEVREMQRDLETRDDFHFRKSDAEKLKLKWQMS